VHLGSSDGPATHTLVVDAAAGVASIAPVGVARRIVHQQSLDQETEP